MTHYDVIIIGTGAGGGTLAYHLAPSGKRILLLERGDYVRREKDNWSSRAVNVEGKYNTKEVWHDKDGQAAPPAHELLRRRQHQVLRRGAVPPAQGGLRRDHAPRRRLAGVADQLRRARAVLHEGRAPLPGARRARRRSDRALGERAVPVPGRAARAAHPAAARRPGAPTGCVPFHVPLGIMLDESDPHKSRCIRCETCDGFPCLVHAKSDAQVICVDPALAHPNVTLLTNAKVTRLRDQRVGPRGDGRRRRSATAPRRLFSADIVVSSCGAINSAALLLRSATDRHPNGLANGSDVVGRHYMGHVNSVLLAISKSPNPTVFQKTLGVNDFYFGDDDFKYPMGHISFVGKLDAIALSAGAPAIVPGMTLDLMAKHSLDFWLTSEDLPDPDNRVTLDRDGNIVLSYTPNNDEGHKRLIKKLEHLLQHLDMHPHLVPRNLFVGKRIPLAGVAHQNGTIRFGNDPKTSALDANCKAHDVDNLYVVDGSFFPSSGAVNPALTIMANALRVGDHMLERLGARAAVSMEARVMIGDSRSGRHSRRARTAAFAAALLLALAVAAPLPRRPVAPRRCRSRRSTPSASPSPTWIARSPSTPACCRSRRCRTTECPGARTSC